MTETPQNPEGQPGVSPDSAASAAGSATGDSSTQAATPQPVPAQTPASPSAADATPTAVYAAHAAPHTPQGAAFGPAAVAGPPTTDSAQTGPGAPKDRRGRRLIVPLVAALAVGAIIGGATGAGIVLATGADSNNSRVVSESNGTSSNVVVNRASDATTVTAVAAAVSPSVVTIEVSGSSSAGTGSGVILSDDGYILTNTHVVTLDGAAADATIKVQTSDGKYWDATVVGTDPIVDLAVIKLTDASGPHPDHFGRLRPAQRRRHRHRDRRAARPQRTRSPTASSARSTAASRSPRRPSRTRSSGDSTDSGSGNDFWNFDLPGQSSRTHRHRIDLAAGHPDGRGDQPRQLGRRAAQQRGRADRHQRRHRQRRRLEQLERPVGQHRRRLLDPVEPRQARRQRDHRRRLSHSRPARRERAGRLDGGQHASIAGAYIAKVSNGGAAAGCRASRRATSSRLRRDAVGSATDLTAQVRVPGRRRVDARSPTSATARPTRPT